MDDARGRRNARVSPYLVIFVNYMFAMMDLPVRVGSLYSTFASLIPLPSPLFVVFATATVVDTKRELRFRADQRYQVVPVLDALEAAGIAAQVRGVASRTLVHSFEPALFMTVYVDREHAERARAMLRTASRL